MHERRNLTISLENDVVRKARIVAAERGVSVSRLVADLIEREIQQRERFEQAREQALRYLLQGFDLGSGGMLPPRESLYDR